MQQSEHAVNIYIQNKARQYSVLITHPALLVSLVSTMLVAQVSLLSAKGKTVIYNFAAIHLRKVFLCQ